MKYLLYYMCPNTKKNQSERVLTKHRIIQSQHNYLFLKKGIPLHHSRTAKVFDINCVTIFCAMTQPL